MNIYACCRRLFEGRLPLYPAATLRGGNRGGGGMGGSGGWNELNMCRGIGI